MVPSVARTGTTTLGTGSGYYNVSGDQDDQSSPFSGASMNSPFYDSTPRNDIGTSYFGFRPASPKTATSLNELENFSFKRLRSLESIYSESADASPVSRPSAKYTRVEPSQLVVARKPMPNPTFHEERKSFEPTMSIGEIPILKLGDEGRAKLKSALSEQAKADNDIRLRIDAIGKIRLASVHQLMQMARVSGLWEYAQSLAQEHELSKAYKRSG
jgi:hypothetical protein